jgi:hypothetical protein
MVTHVLLRMYHMHLEHLHRPGLFVGKTVDTAKLIATDMPRVLRSEPGKRERDDTL